MMATAGHERDPGHPTGYDVVFDPPLDKKHECPVCLFALRDPVQTACGHRFCTGCLKHVLKKARPRCPLDNEVLSPDEIFPDNFCKREILSLTVFCSNRNLGCLWKDILKELQAHKGACDFLVVSCCNEGCDISVSQKDLQTHLQKDCKFRSVVCQLCGQQFIFSQQQAHQDSWCPEVLVWCENDCGLEVKRKEYQEHLTTSCLCVKSVCRFASVGCKFKGSKPEVDKHQANSQDIHTDLLLQHVESLPAEMVSEARVTSKVVVKAGHSNDGGTAAQGSSSDELVIMRQQVQHVMSAMAEKDRMIDDLQQKADGLRSTAEELTQILQRVTSDMALIRQEISSCGSRVSGFEQRHLALQSKFAALEHRQLGIEKTLSVKDNALAEHDVRILSLEMTSYDGILRWKLTELSRRQSEAVAGKRLSIYSPPFYTSRSGYKMCARIYLNGDGMGKGSHLSLFFVLMKGEYDALLPWPFQQRITFTLIDQEQRRHVSDTFQPDPSSSSFQQPTNDMNVASGCPLFVPLEALQTRGYVKDDTMYIRVAVDTKGLVHP